MQQNVVPARSPDSSQELIAGLFGDFLGNFNDFKSGRMSPEAEERYKLLGAPSPSQYCSFNKFFDFFEDGERMVQEQMNQVYTYDLADMETSKPAMLDFFHNLDSSSFTAQGKNIVLAFGSFWGQHLPTREEIILCLNHLQEGGAKVQMYAQVREDEKFIDKIIPAVKKNSRFGINKRIPIHYARGGDEFIFFEFPHTETTILRLNMCLDLNTVKLKKGKTKADLINFFDSLVKAALED
jgi:hypothetical protein